MLLLARLFRKSRHGAPIFPALLCLCLLSCHDVRRDPVTGPDMAFADGHVHAGFVTREGSCAADLGYFHERQIKAFCLSLPLDNSKTGDLRTRIGEEITALGNLAREQNTFRLRLPAQGKNAADPPGEKISVFLNIEYFHGVFNGDPGLVQAYRDMGVKAITLVNNDRDPFFDGEALTPFGRKVIALMNASRMRIDVAHLAASQKLAVIEFSRSPVLDSHANARSVAGIDYNTPDVVLAALKKNRGSVLVSFNRNGVFDERGETTDGVTQLVNHIDHFVRRLGAGHVGIGSDYQAGGKYVAAPLGDLAAFEKIAAELARRGYDAAVVGRILYSNVLNEFADGA
jgi:microsomal dipeptidase-like Zn-dependent dipeptidase